MVLSRSNIRFGSLNGVRTAVVFAVGFVLLALLPSKALAATYTVCASGCDHTTITNAITASSSGDTITVSAGTYAENIDYGAKNITIQSASGAASTFIVGAGVNQPVVKFYNAALTSPVLKGFTISNHTSAGTNARCIYIQGGSNPTLKDLIIKGNNLTSASSVYVGGSGGMTMTGTTVGGDAGNILAGTGLYIYNVSGAVTITDSTLSYNTRAIYLRNVTTNPTLITNTNITNNTGYDGAGIYNDNAPFTVVGGSISDNSSTHYGGGIYMRAASNTLTMSGSTTMTGNTAVQGSAIYSTGIGGINITGATIDNNTSTQNGGAINMVNSMDASTITSSSVSNNSSYNSGGAIYFSSSSASWLAFIDSNIDNNTASSSTADGGAAYVGGANVTLTITGGTVNNNSCRNGAGIYSTGGVDMVVSGATINGNTGTGKGGGIYMTTSSATLNISKSFIQGNTTMAHGGGIAVLSGTTATVANTVISGNRIHTTRWQYGGGIHNLGTLNLYNSTIAGNYAFEDGGGLDASGTETLRNSIIYGNRRGSDFTDEVRGSINTSTTSNISVDPLFADLQHASSSTATTAGDYRLCYGSSSPAAGCGAGTSNGIDTGNATNAPTDDISGDPRPQDIAGIGDGVDDYDMGAYEYATDNVTGFSVTDALSGGQLDLSWTNPSSGAFAGVKLVRATGGTAPSDCTGAAVYDGTGTSYNDTSLSNGTQYSYRICAYDVSSNYATGVTASGTPSDQLAPAQVTSFTAPSASVGNQLNLSWTNPGDGDLAGIKIVRATGGTAPSDCTGTAIYDGSGTSYNDTDLTDGQQYSYRACSYDGSSNYASGATVSGTPEDTTAPADISGLTATAGNAEVVLSWTNPVDADYAGTKVLRKLSAPSSCTDGGATQVYSGTGTGHTDTGLTNDTTYYYLVCAFDEVPNYASGVADSETPTDDSGPPAVISDLQSILSYTRAIKLGWTAPGDDGSTGTATSYDVRFIDAVDYPSNMSTYLNSNWGSLTLTSGEPAPQVAGSTEAFTFGQDSGSNRIIPNTLYYNAIKTTDDMSKESDISNVPTVHTAMKYGYNYVSLPYDASSGGSNTLQNLLGDDVPYLYILKWTPMGLDWGSRFRGRWTRLSSSSAITSSLSNGSGYYMYVYKANTSVLDEKDSGDTALVSENTDNWAKVDLSQGRNLVGNPYTKNVDFNNVKVCESSSFSTSGGCSGGTVKTFIEAVSAGWMDSTVAYYGNATTFTTEVCSSVECVAKLRPWWGQWVYLLDGSGSYVMAVPKP